MWFIWSKRGIRSGRRRSTQSWSSVIWLWTTCSRAILQTFPADPVIRVAVEYGRGLRIIRQRPWECLATFLTSPLKQVRQIRAISLSIRKRFGRRLRAMTNLKLFPIRALNSSQKLSWKNSLSANLDSGLGTF